MLPLHHLMLSAMIHVLEHLRQLLGAWDGREGDYLVPR